MSEADLKDIYFILITVAFKFGIFNSPLGNEHNLEKAEEKIVEISEDFVELAWPY